MKEEQKRGERHELWTDDEGEVRELTDELFARAKKFSDFPEEEQRDLKQIMESAKKTTSRRRSGNV
jgi:hypothetical protein